MNPPPPTAPGNGVATLMAEIERIAQELRAYNKRPLPATEDQVQALVKLAERDRPLTLHVDSAAVAQLLIGEVEQQRKDFRTTGIELVTYLDNRKRLIAEELDARIAALRTAEAKLQATTDRIPKQVPLNVLSNWRSAVVVAFVPLLMVLLGMLLTGHFSRVPRAELDILQAENAHIRQANEQLTRQGMFYRAQVDTYRKKFPKSARYFPPYVVPTTSPVEAK